MSYFLISESKVSRAFPNHANVNINSVYDNSMPRVRKHMSQFLAVVNTTYKDTQMWIRYRNFRLTLSLSHPNVGPIYMKFEYVMLQNISNQDK